MINPRRYREMRKFIKSLLNPDEFGYVVSAEVQDRARELLNWKPVESAPKRQTESYYRYEPWRE